MLLCWSKLGRSYTQARCQSLWELIAFTQCPGPAEDAPVLFSIQVKASEGLFLGIVLKRQKIQYLLVDKICTHSQGKKHGWLLHGKYARNQVIALLKAIIITIIKHFPLPQVNIVNSP